MQKQNDSTTIINNVEEGRPSSSTQQNDIIQLLEHTDLKPMSRKRLSQIARFELHQRYRDSSTLNNGKATAARFHKYFMQISTRKPVSFQKRKQRCDHIVELYLADRKQRKQRCETLSDIECIDDADDSSSSDEQKEERHCWTRPFDYGTDVLADIASILRNHVTNEVPVHWRMISNYIKILCILHGKRHLLAPSEGGEYVIGKRQQQPAIIQPSTSQPMVKSRFGQSHVRRLVQRLNLPMEFARGGETRKVGGGGGGGGSNSTSRSQPHDDVPFNPHILYKIYPIPSLNYARVHHATVHDAINHMKKKSGNNNNASHNSCCCSLSSSSAVANSTNAQFQMGLPSYKEESLVSSLLLLRKGCV